MAGRELREELLATAVENASDKDVMELLFSREPPSKITETILAAAAGNDRSTVPIEYLIAQDATIEVTERVIKAVPKYGSEVLEILCLRPNIGIAEDVLLAALEAWNPNSSLFLNIETNPTALRQAVYFGPLEWFKKLISRYQEDAIRQCGQLVRAAVEGCHPEILKLILRLDGVCICDYLGPDEDGWNLQMVVAQSRNTWAAKLLADEQNLSL
jgi:hypothetical protein